MKAPTHEPQNVLTTGETDQALVALRAGRWTRPADLSLVQRAGGYLGSALVHGTAIAAVMLLAPLPPPFEGPAEIEIPVELVVMPQEADRTPETRQFTPQAPANEDLEAADPPQDQGAPPTPDEATASAGEDLDQLPAPPDVPPPDVTPAPMGSDTDALPPVPPRRDKPEIAEAAPEASPPPPAATELIPPAPPPPAEVPASPSRPESSQPTPVSRPRRPARVASSATEPTTREPAGRVAEREARNRTQREPEPSRKAQAEARPRREQAEAQNARVEAVGRQRGGNRTAAPGPNIASPSAATASSSQGQQRPPTPRSGNTARADANTYRGQVIAHLTRFKRYPESAMSRGAEGVPTVAFSLDASGGVTQVSLTRSSGQGDIDAEVIAMVRRAVPFPPPQPGAPQSFSASIAFQIR